MTEIIINKAFEEQDIKTIYKIDFDGQDNVKLVFSDGYYVIISDNVTHNDNHDTVEVCLYSPENEVKLINWVSCQIDEAPFRLYNWHMNLENSETDNIFNLIFERGISMGGGFF